MSVKHNNNSKRAKSIFVKDILGVLESLSRMCKIWKKRVHYSYSTKFAVNVLYVEKQEIGTVSFSMTWSNTAAHRSAINAIGHSQHAW